MTMAAPARRPSSKWNRSLDDSILPPVHPIIQPDSGGPFSPSTLADSAVRQLREDAEAMTARGCSVEEIAVALAKTAELWRARGADLPSDTVATILPSHKTIPTNLPLVEQVWRVCTLAGWLYGHAGTEVAGLVCDAGEAILLARNEEDNIPC